MNTSAGYAPTLRTERLVLRPLARSDLEDLHRISNDPLVRRYMWDDKPVPRDRLERLIRHSSRMFADGGAGLFGIRLRGSEVLAGFCGFFRMEGAREMELCYGLTPQLWGEGLATEASRVCLRHAFEELGAERVVAGADRPNAASLRVIEKLGMYPIDKPDPGAQSEPYFALRREDYFAFVADDSEDRRR